MTDKRMIDWLINQLLLDETTCKTCCYYGTTPGEYCAKKTHRPKTLQFAKAPPICRKGIRLYAEQQEDIERANKRMGTVGEYGSYITLDESSEKKKQEKEN